LATIEDERIESALLAMLSADVDGLRLAIHDDPEIVSIRWGGNTLLEWATQPPDGIASEVVDVLIQSGSALDRALNLAGCWNLPGMCRQLVDAGADPAARADAGITPLESAAMHGSVDAADVLVAHGLHRPSLWLAAATGQLDAVLNWLSPSGDLLRPPGPRPIWEDVGRPPGAPPTDDPAEVLGEAFVLAAANGRLAVADRLLAAGAGVDARPYRNTTGLHFAIQFHNADAVAHLVDRGAALTIRDDEYSSDAAGWAQACLDGSEASLRVAHLIGTRPIDSRDPATT